MGKTFQMVRPEPKTPQHTITVTKSDNNPWWIGEPNTTGAIPSISFLTEEEMVKECVRLGFTQRVEL